jgi:predicted kinase
MSKPKLTIMCGIPRCGKGSWIKKNRVRECIVSPDDIRKEMFGHQFHAPANKFVFGVAEGMTSLLLKQGHDVIVDATHISSGTRLAWRGIANTCNADVRVVWVRACKDPERNFLACLERNELSEEGQQLPMDALLRMGTFFEDPDSTYEDWFELVVAFNPHRRKLPPEKRINIEAGDGMLQLMQKGEKLWHVVENKERDS